MKIKTMISLSSNDLENPYKECRLYTVDGKSLGYGKELVSKTPMGTVLTLEIDAKDILRYIKECRDNG